MRMARAGIPGDVPRIAACAVVALLCVATALAFLAANLIPDGTRDLAASLAIARGERLPIDGPAIDLRFHLSALWLYLQAVPLLVSTRFAAVGVFVGLLAAAKLVFAYRLGTLIADRRLGVLCALAAALPSVAAYQSLYLLHPALVETCVWAAFLAAAAALATPRIGLVYLCALAIGVGIQVHPTAAFYVALPWCVLAMRRAAFGRIALHACALVLPIAAPFVPQLVAAALGVAPAGDTMSLAGIPPPPAPPIAAALRDTPALALAAFWTIPRLVLTDAWSPLVGFAAARAIAVAALAVVHATAAWGALHARRLAPPLRGLLAASVAGTLVGVAIVSAMRIVVGYYALYFLLPLAALGWALALHAATVRVQSTIVASRLEVAPLAPALSVLLFVMALAPAMGAWHRNAAGEIDQYVGGLSDVRKVDDARARVVDVSLLTHDRLASWLCNALADPRPLVLHGDLAFAERASFGADLAMRCPREARLPWMLGRDVAGAAAAPMHWLGVPGAAAAAIGRAPERKVGELALFPVVDVRQPHDAHPLDRRWRYYETVESRQPAAVLRESFLPSAGRHLAVSRMQPWATTHEIDVRCAGHALVPVYATLTLTIFALADAACELALTTDVPDTVEVLVF
jgi:hypothetical protein